MSKAKKPTKSRRPEHSECSEQNPFVLAFAFQVAWIYAVLHPSNWWGRR